MELSSFSENVVTVPYETNGDTAYLQVNIDAILPEYFDALEERLAPLVGRIEAIQDQIKKLSDKKAKKDSKSLTALQLEKEVLTMQREAHAERLTCPVRLPDGSTTCLLKGWDTTVNGSPVPATRETLLTMPPRIVKDLWETCRNAAQTVKKRVELETGETLDGTQDGSPGLRVVGQNT